MTLSLSSEQSAIIDQAIEAGLIQTPEDIIALGVQALRYRMEKQRADALPYEEW